MAIAWGLVTYFLLCYLHLLTLVCTLKLSTNKSSSLNEPPAIFPSKPCMMLISLSGRVTSLVEKCVGLSALSLKNRAASMQVMVEPTVLTIRCATLSRSGDRSISIIFFVELDQTLSLTRTTPRALPARAPVCSPTSLNRPPWAFTAPVSKESPGFEQKLHRFAGFQGSCFFLQSFSLARASNIQDLVYKGGHPGVSGPFWWAPPFQSFSLARASNIQDLVYKGGHPGVNGPLWWAPSIIPTSRRA